MGLVVFPVVVVPYPPPPGFNGSERFNDIPLMFTTHSKPAWLKRWQSLEAGETSSQKSRLRKLKGAAVVGNTRVLVG